MLPAEIGRTVIVLSFLLGAFLIADWYHFYYGNSYPGIVYGAVLGVLLAVFGLGVAVLVTSYTISELALFDPAGAWSGRSIALKCYISGMGLTATALASVPRLALIHLVSGNGVPRANGI